MTNSHNTGIGHRADWRFLLPPGPRQHLLVAGARRPGLGESSNGGLAFLQTDGWVDLVTAFPDAPAGSPTTELSPDVLLVLRHANAADAAAVLARAAPTAVAVVELGRSPLARYQRLRAIRRSGFDLVGLYVVTPHLDRPKRFVPLDRQQATTWLLAGPPPIDGTPKRASGMAWPRVVKRKARASMTAAATKALAPATTSPITAALAGAGTEGLAIATRGHRLTDWKSNWKSPVLMTSGHDEGSRAVLVNLADGSTTPTTVTKVSSRPRYNQNAANEVKAIRSIRETVEDTAALRLIPKIIDVADADDVLLHRSTEAYAGRWTAADLCHRVPESRHQVLRLVLDAIDDFSVATRSDTAKWSKNLFDEYLGGLFDRYRALPGKRPELGALQATLQERSTAMIGRPVPLMQRHYDLGPWNVVIDDSGQQLTIIDWELAPPRSLNRTGFGGADQLYFLKYWMHAAMQTTSLNDEQAAFEFLPGEPRTSAAEALKKSLDRLEIDPGFIPLIAGHLWLETALYTAARRDGGGGSGGDGDPGSAAHYLETLQRWRSQLTDFWRPAPSL